MEIADPGDPAFLDPLLEHGWTPMTRGEFLPWIQGWLLGENLPDYDRGEYKGQTLRLSGECSETIRFHHAVDFRLSQKAPKLSEWMTNRTPVWIRTSLTAELNLSDPASLHHTGMGFPTWDVYLGSNGGELSKVGHQAQESVLEFIARGGKRNNTSRGL